MIEQLKKYNDLYINNNSYGNEMASEIFDFDDKKSSLIICAPHATKSFVKKEVKSADLFTGAIAKFLGEDTKTSTIIRNKLVLQKELISDYIISAELGNHYFLDIHGFNKDIDYDVCIGIAGWQEADYPYLDKIKEVIKKYNLRFVVNHEDYTGAIGLTGRYQKHFNKPNVIQIELKKYLRDFYNNSDTVINITLPMLKEIVECYK